MKANRIVGAASTVLAAAAIVAGSQLAAAQGPPEPTSGTLLTAELPGMLGGTIGPDGALYLPTFAGNVERVDPATGAVTTHLTGLPVTEEGGGPSDIIFVGDVLYVLTSGTEPVAATGIYRVEADDSLTLIADIGAFNTANAPDGGDIGPTGNPFSIDYSGGNFIVSESNHNRILEVQMDGTVSIVASFDNIVPTGLAVNGTSYFSQIGPFPHEPETGIVHTIDLATGDSSPIASGVAYLIDVEYGPGGVLYALSFGDAPSNFEDPAEPFTGKLVRVVDGSLEILVDRLLLPTSLQFADGDALIGTLAGQAWRIDDVASLEELEPTPTETATATATATEPATETATSTTVPPTATSTTVPPTATNTTAPPTATSTVKAPRPPSTGTGSFDGDGGGHSYGLIVAAGLGALALGGGALATALSRRRD